MKRTLLAASLVAIATALNLSGGPVTLLTNGGFESGNLNGWTTTTTPLSGSTSCYLAFAAATGAAGCGTGLNPVSGLYAAYASASFPFNNPPALWSNTLTQTFVVPNGVTITNALLSYMYTATATGNGSFQQLDLVAQLFSGSTLLGSQTLLQNPVQGYLIPWTTDFFDLTSLLNAHQGETLTLQLSSTASFQIATSPVTRSTKFSMGFDDIQITLNPVPEPPTVVLMASVLGLGIVFRNRTRFSRRLPPQSSPVS